MCNGKATKTAGTKYNITKKYLAFILPRRDRFAVTLLRGGGSGPSLEDFSAAFTATSDWFR